MKTMTNKKVVEVEEFEQIYECDSCGFQAKYSYDVAEHEFNMHQVKASHDVNGQKFYWLDNQQDMDNLISGGSSYGRTSGAFYGPDWYGIYVYEEPATYYNSYYEDDQATIRSIDWFIEMWNNRVEDANHSLSDAYKLLEQHDDH